MLDYLNWDDVTPMQLSHDIPVDMIEWEALEEYDNSWLDWFQGIPDISEID